MRTSSRTPSTFSARAAATQPFFAHAMKPSSPKNKPVERKNNYYELRANKSQSVTTLLAEALQVTESTGS